MLTREEKKAIIEAHIQQACRDIYSLTLESHAAEKTNNKRVLDQATEMMKHALGRKETYETALTELEQENAATE